MKIKSQRLNGKEWRLVVIVKYIKTADWINVSFAMLEHFSGNGVRYDYAFRNRDKWAMKRTIWALTEKKISAETENKYNHINEIMSRNNAAFEEFARIARDIFLAKSRYNEKVVDEITARMQDLGKKFGFLYNGGHSYMRNTELEYDFFKE